MHSFFTFLFQIFSLHFVWRNLIMMCIVMDFFGFILFLVYLASWICAFIFSTNLRSFQLSNGTQWYECCIYCYCPTRSWDCSFLSSLFLLLSRLGKFYWNVLKFTDFIFCHLHLTIEPISEFNFFLIVIFSSIISICLL